MFKKCEADFFEALLMSAKRSPLKPVSTQSHQCDGIVAEAVHSTSHIP
jgi:hypothetical protein